MWCSDGQKYVHRSQKIILSGDRDKDVWHKIDVEREEGKQMEKNAEYGAGGCRNVFTSEPSDRGKNFMRLWLQVICEREELVIKKDRQAVSLEL